MWLPRQQDGAFLVAKETVVEADWGVLRVQAQELETFKNMLFTHKMYKSVVNVKCIQTE